MLRALLRRGTYGRPLVLVIVGVILAVLFVGFGLIGSRGSSGARSAHEPTRAFDTGLDDARKVAAFVESYGQRIDATEKRLTAKDDELKSVREHASKLENALVLLLDQLEKIRSLPPAPAPERSDAATGATSLPRLTRVALTSRSTSETRERAAVRLPAGSLATATLLTGVYAPIEGGALPVALKVDAVFNGPNHSRIPIQGALLIGRAEGEPNSTRIVIQLEKLSYVAPSGRSIEVPVNGFVADSDGVQGLAGTYVWRVRETAAYSAAGGALSGLSEALWGMGGMTESTPAGVAKLAAGRGAERAADALERTVARRLEQVVPAIHVANGKRLTVLLLEGVTLDGLTVNEVRDATSRNPHAGLDLDR